MTQNRQGFTLLELILVVVILLLASSMAVPSFIRSYQTARLRTGARDVVTSAKFARNMAVLQQNQMAIFFDTEGGTIEVRSVQARGGRDDLFLNEPRRQTGEEVVTTDTLLQRTLPDDIVISDYSMPSRLQEVDGVFWVNYYPSGISDTYSMRLTDRRRNQSIRIEIDPLAGSAKTTYEP